MSPLHIVTGAITANSQSRCDVLGIQRALWAGRQAIMVPVRDRLTKYFGMCLTTDAATQVYLFNLTLWLTRTASHPTLQRDWGFLASQSAGCTFKLETETCDPVASQLINEKDMSL